MITARNYAAQGEKALKLMLSEQIGNAHKTMSLDLDALSKSQHFALPDDSLLLGAKGVGLFGTKLHLPYPFITIEYYLPKDNYKVLIIAVEENNEIYCRLLLNTKKFDWSYIPIGLHIGDGDGPFEAGFRASSSYAKGFEDVCDSFPKETKDFFKTAIFTPVTELLEALSCRNVYTELLEPVNSKVNERRAKAGKLPLYETKILVVDSKPKEIDPNWKGGTHASPRQHLRRGHIRRYEDYSIWINNQVVGKASNGKIDKSYEVK